MDWLYNFLLEAIAYLLVALPILAILGWILMQLLEGMMGLVDNINRIIAFFSRRTSSKP